MAVHFQSAKNLFQMGNYLVIVIRIIIIVINMKKNHNSIIVIRNSSLFYVEIFSSIKLLILNELTTKAHVF